MQRIVRAFRPGILAAGPALLALAAGPLVLGGPGLLEAVADGVLRTTPISIFETVLEALGPAAKGALFATVAAAAVLAGGILGAVLGRGLAPGSSVRNVPRRGALVGVVALALAEAVVLPLAGAGFFGSAYQGSQLSLHLPILVASVAFGVTFAALEPLPTRDVPSAAVEPEPGAPAGSPASPSVLPRRTFLAGSLAVTGLAAAGVVVVGRIVSGVSASRPAARPTAAPGGAGAATGAPGGGGTTGFGPTPAITPIADHYVVAKDLTPPSVDGAAWRLQVDGLVARPTALTLDQVRALASAAETRTLICISNTVEDYGPYAGTQVWTGTPVATVLQAAGGPTPDARFVLWTSADGYTESIALDVALDPRSFLAWGMGPDAAPLPAEHGYPLRVLLPGRYGMKQPKWLTRITLAAADRTGYWEERGWDEAAVVRTWSRIDDPRDGDSIAAGTPIQAFGVAFAGERGIKGVEASIDDGRTWVAAELEPPPGPLSWVRWRASLPAVAAGPTLLRVRATDGTGALQPEASEPPLPRGAAGWQRVRIVAG